MKKTKEIKNSKFRFNRITTYLRKPEHIILIIFGILLSLVTIAPMITLFRDTFMIKPGSFAQFVTGRSSGYTLVNWIDLFAGDVAKINLYTPMLNSVLLAVFSSLGAILFGGVFAYLITRTNMMAKRYLSAIFIFPYIMPQWTLAVIWQNLFKSNLVTGGSDGVLTSFLGISMPLWWTEGLIPSVIILSIHYAPFAYILIGSIFRNMDSNLEEAAVIMNTPKSKTFMKITLPMVYPAILSTVLLVFASAMGSYPVPHYLQLNTLATRYVSLGVRRAGENSILGVLMMLFGVLILLINHRNTKSRKSYTTVTGKSGQISEVNIGKVLKYLIPGVLIVITFFTSIYPILAFTLETFLPNPGDYSFLLHGSFDTLTTKWWLHDGVAEVGLYGQAGILHNKTIWNGFKGTLIVSTFAALFAGTFGVLIGYAVSRNRRNKFALYVNNMAFLPYLLPALAVGIAFFTFGSALGIYDTFLLVIIAGTVKYIPFASRSSLNSMMQISPEIEESAMILGISWIKRMTKIIIPIQKAAIISAFLLPFITSVRELTLYMLLVNQTRLSTTLLDYYDEMGLYAFSSGINLIIIIFILLLNFAVNKLTGASLDKGVGGK